MYIHIYSSDTRLGCRGIHDTVGFHGFLRALGDPRGFLALLRGELVVIYRQLYIGHCISDVVYNWPLFTRRYVLADIYKYKYIYIYIYIYRLKRET